MRHLTQWFLAGRAVTLGAARSLFGGSPPFCVICQRRVPAFLPWRGGSAAAPKLMRLLDVVGSDLDHFSCPRCGATDRDRHLRLYMDRLGLGASMRDKRVLHFAPEPGLSRWLASLEPSEYVRADLVPSAPGVREVNIESIPFADDSFDVVIANHVLEHVDDLDAATDEIARVLAPSGTAILQTPWCSGLSSTIDDPAVRDPRARLELYGQEDHARLFGRDVYRRIGGRGLVAAPVTHESVLHDTDPSIHGVNPREDCMLFRRSNTVETIARGWNAHGAPP